VLKKFNAYCCYELSDSGKNPGVLLADNAPSHSIPRGAKSWISRDPRGFRMSNVLVTFFLPNCTLMVQPLGAGCIKTAKALFRKRHMQCILRRLEIATESAEPPMVNCDVRQAIEWFMWALSQEPATSVAYCRISTRILSMLQIEDLRTGGRHNGRAARGEVPNSSTTVPAAIIDELSELLSGLGKPLASDKDHPVKMIEAAEVVDQPMERKVFDPPEGESSQDEVDPGANKGDDHIDGDPCEEDDGAGGGEMIDVQEVDTDDVDPQKLISLEEASGSLIIQGNCLLSSQRIASR